MSLISGGGKVYTDIAARFTRSDKSLDDILATPYDADLVQKIINSGHNAAVEFDYFIFGVEGYARVTEVQLVRKRLASYLIKSGRVNKNGKRLFDMVLPDSISDYETRVNMQVKDIEINGEPLNSLLPNKYPDTAIVSGVVNPYTIFDITEQWYNNGVSDGYPEQDLRYMKQQATEFKAIIGMNAHSLLDWFQIRVCLNAQDEIRDMATKMLNLCKEAVPDLFKNAGASCKVLGYCPENSMQNRNCTCIRKDEALRVLKQYNNKTRWHNDRIKG